MANYVEYGWNNIVKINSTGYLFDYVRRQLKKNDCILDVGCGNGEIANLLLKEGFNIYGIDASLEGIQIANKNLGKERFYVCDIEDGKLPEQLRNIDFNVVISTEVIEHVYSPKQYIIIYKKSVE